MCTTVKEAKLKKKYVPAASGAGRGVLSITTLKLLVLPLMTLDHIYVIFINIFDIPIEFKYAGRIVYPIFILASTEGYYYTRDKKKYIFRLLTSACIMQLGNYILNNLLPREDGFILKTNIFIPIMFIALFLYLIDKIKNKKDIFISISIIIISISYLNYLGQLPFVLLGLLLYQLRNNKINQLIIYCIFSLLFIRSYQVYMLAAAPLIYFYNGQKGKGLKTLFYLYYPGHIYLMYIISIIILQIR